MKHLCRQVPLPSTLPLPRPCLPWLRTQGPRPCRAWEAEPGSGCLELAVPSGQLGLHKVVVKAEAAPEEAFLGGVGPRCANLHLQGRLEQLAAAG